MSRSSVALLAPKPKLVLELVLINYIFIFCIIFRRLPEYLVPIMPFTLWLWVAVLVSFVISAASLIIVDFFRIDMKIIQPMVGY